MKFLLVEKLSEGTSGDSRTQKSLNRSTKSNIRKIAQRLDGKVDFDCKYVIDVKSMAVHHINDIKDENGLKNNSFNNLLFICSDDSRDNETVHKILHYMDRHEMNYKQFIDEIKRVKVYKYNEETGDFEEMHPFEVSEKLMESVGKLNEVYPNKGESKDDFISRFMSVTKNEYPDRKQRYAVALSYWDRRNKSKKK